jgi:protocatechuate 3,4-dioxygenase, beta subunit
MEGRRVMKTTALLLIVSLTSVCAGQAARVADGRAAPNDAATWQAVVAAADEPGEPLVVTGTVYAEDGSTPLKGATVYVYQTDARGYYGAGDSNDSANPRLRATMRTDERGRYEYRTVKPGSYPGTRNPAHIHYVVNAPGFKEKVFEIVFDDDPFVDGRIRADAAREGSFFSIRKAERDNRGVLRCTQDVALRRR